MSGRFPIGKNALGTVVALDVVMMKHGAFLFLGFALVACGDSGSEFEGEYRVVSHMSGDCASQNTSQTGGLEGEEYFKLQVENIFGTEILGHFTCSAPGQCDDSMNLSSSFISKAGEWVISNSSSFNSQPGMCNLSATRGTIATTDEGIEIVVTERRGVVNEQDCDAAFDNIDSHLDSLDCESVDVVVAEPI